MHAQSAAPLTVNALVENQTCISKDFVQVTLSASATSDSQPVGFRWDFTSDGKFDTPRSTETTAVHVYADEGFVTAKVGAINKLGQQAQDTVSFATLNCH
jgi:PKD repeat protein